MIIQTYYINEILFAFYRKGCIPMVQKKLFIQTDRMKQNMLMVELEKKTKMVT